jgi:hypothetical protein
MNRACSMHGKKYIKEYTILVRKAEIKSLASLRCSWSIILKWMVDIDTSLEDKIKI